MRFDSVDRLPAKVHVAEIVVSRYKNGLRPESWDLRRSGEDIIRTVDGKTLKLKSDGGQSPPHKGWVVVLTEGDAANGYSWTLYSIASLSTDPHPQ